MKRSSLHPLSALLSSFSLGLALLTGCGTSGPADVEQLTLPGDTFYPESLSISADGTLFIGSLGTGQVVRFKPGSTSAEVFIAPGSIKNVAGVLVDDESQALYLCAVDISGATASTLRSFKLEDGAPLATYSFPASAFCNDLAFDGQRNLYVTDSYGKIYRLPHGGSQLALWSSEAMLAPSSPMGFGADGIVWDGKDGLYVNTYSDSGLARIPIKTDGSAGTATKITVTPALSFPDGMRLLSDNTLLLVEGAGRLTKLTMNGSSATATTLSSSLNGPTSVVRYQQSAWVSEGQLGHLFGQIAGAPSTPFMLRRVALP